jgi:hypothetical protein
MEVLAVVLGCAVVCAAQTTVEQSTPEPSVSIDRIHKRLNQPAVLQLPTERQADFRATIVDAFTLPETVLDALRRDLAGDITAKRILPGTISPALISVDLWQIATHVHQRVKGALRARAQRNARAEVAAVLAEFCAEHDCSGVEPSVSRRSNGEGRKQSLPEGVLAH